MELNMDADLDPYDADGFYTDTDPLSGHDQISAPFAPPHDIAHNMEPSELANLLNAAGASKVLRTRLPQPLMHNSDEAYLNNHQFMESDLNNRQFNEADPNEHQFIEANSNNHQFNGFSNNPQSNGAYLNNNNPQFNQTDPGNHEINEGYSHDHHSVDATPNTEETDTLGDELPNFKRRRTEYAESSHTAMAPEHASGTTSAARTSIASVSTGRSSRFSSSTARSSIVSTSTGRSSVASMISPATSADQSGEEGAYKYKCLVCHMGEGSSRKVYSRKEGNTSGAPKPKNSWNSPALLAKHIREDHIVMFERTNSSEYICFFCPCGDVTEQHCGGRFPDKNALLNHVATAHHEIPTVRPRYHHLCAPLNSRSYPQKLFDKLTRRDSSGSD